MDLWSLYGIWIKNTLKVNLTQIWPKSSRIQVAFTFTRIPTKGFLIVPQNLNNSWARATRPVFLISCRFRDINLELRHGAAQQMCEFCYCGRSSAWLSSPVVRLFTRPQGQERDHTDHQTRLHKHCRRAEDGPAHRAEAWRSEGQLLRQRWSPALTQQSFSCCDTDIGRKFSIRMESDESKLTNKNPDSRRSECISR